MANIKDNTESGDGKHAHARRLAEAALRAEAEGNEEEAERLFTEAEHTDPEAVADVLQERDTAFGRDATDRRTGDRTVERIVQQPPEHTDAPSRAGITGAGSGADSEKG